MKKSILAALVILLLQHERVPQFACNWALFLDVDGTLLDIAQNPDGVTVSRELHSMLKVAHQLNSHAVALISGTLNPIGYPEFWKPRGSPSVGPDR